LPRLRTRGPDGCRQRRGNGLITEERHTHKRHTHRGRRPREEPHGLRVFPPAAGQWPIGAAGAATSKASRPSRTVTLTSAPVPTSPSSSILDNTLSTSR